MRLHPRGTFVTASLANGRSESRLADRTGHRSSALLSRYKRMARTFEELHIGDFVPMDEALGRYPTTRQGTRAGRLARFPAFS